MTPKGQLTPKRWVLIDILAYMQWNTESIAKAVEVATSRQNWQIKVINTDIWILSCNNCLTSKHSCQISSAKRQDHKYFSRILINFDASNVLLIHQQIRHAERLPFQPMSIHHLEIVSLPLISCDTLFAWKAKINFITVNNHKQNKQVISLDFFHWLSTKQEA